jgi:hypothetical protein
MVSEPADAGRIEGAHVAHRRANKTLRALTAAALCAAGVVVGVVTAAPASATGLQTTVLSPIDGRVTSSPDEAPPHHRAYGGDYSFDVAAAGNVFARFRNTNGSLSLTVASVGPACASGRFADGGNRVTLNVVINGSKVGTVAYAHLTDLAFTSGNVPVGARIGRTVTNADGVSSNGCWTGPHVHVEPRNDFRYGCYLPGRLGGTANGDTVLGIVGGERAGAVNVPCGANPETPGGGGGGSVGEGSFVGRPDGAVFRIAGGAPLYVSTWDAFGGPQPTTAISWETYNALPAFPAAGTWLRGSRTGRVFRVINDGIRYYIGSWDPYGGPQPTIDVDDFALDQCDHLRCTPFGSLDGVTGIPGGVSVAGWAMDPDSLDPVDVHVYADGAYVTAFTANAERPDVDNVFHRGSRFGYARNVALATGSHEVCVFAINVATGADNPRLGCATVSAAARDVSALTAIASASRVKRNARVRLTAAVSVGGGAAAGRPVTLSRYEPASGTWVNVARKTTLEPSGSTSFIVRPTASTTYRLHYAGDFSTRPSAANLRILVRQ